jgi:ribosomal protein S18 acetylase RimI-like enzyme
VVSEFARYEPKPNTARTAEPAQSVSIRPAEVRDAQALAEISARRERSGDVEARRKRFEEQVTLADGFVVVAEVEGQVVGYGRVVHHPGSHGCPPGWYLMGLVVSPEFRRRGIGERLTLARLYWIAARADKAFYVANAQNMVTIELHARVGFKEITREFTFPGIEFQGGEGVLFAADLTDHGPQNGA